MYCRTKVSVHINRSVRSDFVLKLFTNFWAGEWEQNLCAIVELFSNHRKNVPIMSERTSIPGSIKEWAAKT